MILLGGPVYIESNKKRISSTEINILDYDTNQIAKIHSSLGYKSAYAPYIPTCEINLIKKVEKAFAKQNVVLAEMGFWKNLQCQNEYKRMQNIEYMCEVLASADEMGVKCVVNTIGSYSFDGIYDDYSENNFTDEFFDAAAETARYIIKHVKPKRTKFTYNNFAFTALDSVDQIEKMVKAVDNDSFGVHLDATNLVTSVREFFSFKDILNDAFKRLGDKIVSCHIKDLRLAWPATHIEMQETTPGLGMLDIASYLKKISALNRDIPCMLEHLDSEEKYAQARENIFEIAKENGLDI